MTHILNKLPADDKEEAMKILHLVSVSWQVLQSYIDSGGLKSTYFRPEVQSKVLAMAYDGEQLFGKPVDKALQAIKSDTATARSLGTLQRLNTFRGQRGRGNYYLSTIPLSGIPAAISSTVHSATAVLPTSNSGL